MEIVRHGVVKSIFEANYLEHVGDVIWSMLQCMTNDLSTLLVGMVPEGDPVECLGKNMAVNQYVIYLLLGAMIGTLQIYNLERLELWFELW